jgi:hypothetical protein
MLSIEKLRALIESSIIESSSAQRFCFEAGAERFR